MNNRVRNAKIKIRYLKDINSSKFLNQYKIAQKASLKRVDNHLIIDSHNCTEKIIKVLEISPFTHGGLHLEQWVKVKFINKDEMIQEWYFLEDSWFGLGNGNKKLVAILKEKIN